MSRSTERGTQRQLLSPDTDTGRAQAGSSSALVAQVIMSSFSNLDTAGGDSESGERHSNMTSLSNLSDAGARLPRRRPMPKRMERLGSIDHSAKTDITEKTRNTSTLTTFTAAKSNSNSIMKSVDRSGEQQAAVVPSSLMSAGIQLSGSHKRLLAVRQQRDSGIGTSTGTSSTSQKDREQKARAIAGKMQSRRMSSQRRQIQQRPTSRSRPSQRQSTHPESNNTSQQVALNKDAKVREYASSTVEKSVPPTDRQRVSRPEIDHKGNIEAQEAPAGVKRDATFEQDISPSDRKETSKTDVAKRPSLSDSIVSINSGGATKDATEVNVTAARVYVGRDISTQLSVASSMTESHAIGPSRDPPADSLEAICTASSIARANSSQRIDRRYGSYDSSGASGSEEELLNKAQVEAWLAQQCLERYSQKFIEEGYDSLGRIMHLDMSELERMKVLPGHRRSLMRAIHSLRKQDLGGGTNLPRISEEPPATTDQTVIKKSLKEARQSLRSDQDRLRRRITSIKSNKRQGAMALRASSQTLANTKMIPAVTKKVRFSIAEVRTYERMWSDNPSVSAGPPVGIGWRYNPRLTIRFSVIRAQHQRSTKYNHGYCPILTRDEREECLREAGCSTKDIAKFTREAIKSKNQRRTTVQNASFGPTAEIEEKIENIGRTIKKAIKPEKNLMHKNTAA